MEVGEDKSNDQTESSNQTISADSKNLDKTENNLSENVLSNNNGISTEKDFWRFKPEEVNENKQLENAETEKDKDKSKSKKKKKSKDREKDRERSKEKDKHKSKDKDKDKDKEQEKDRSKDREKDKVSERDRDKERDREREREKERDRDRDRGRDRDRDRYDDYYRDDKFYNDRKYDSYNYERDRYRGNRYDNYERNRYNEGWNRYIDRDLERRQDEKVRDKDIVREINVSDKASEDNKEVESSNDKVSDLRKDRSHSPRKRKSRDDSPGRNKSSRSRSRSKRRNDNRKDETSSNSKDVTSLVDNGNNNADYEKADTSIVTGSSDKKATIESKLNDTGIDKDNNVDDKERDIKNKDKDAVAKKDRDRDRDRDRYRGDRYRSKSRDRYRSKSRDRYRSKSREKYRSKSPDRRDRRSSKSPDRRDRDRKREDRSKDKPEQPKKITIKDILAANPGISMAEAVSKLSAYNTAIANGLPPPEITGSMGTYTMPALLELTNSSSKDALAIRTALQSEVGLTSKPHRELNISNLPPGCTPKQVAEFVNTCMKQLGYDNNGLGAVVTAWVSPDNSYAFIELTTIEEASAALNYLNGIQIGAYQLKVSRPKGYIGPTTGIALGAQSALASNPLLGISANLAGSLGMSALATSLTSNSNFIMISNLSLEIQENQVKELVSPFGELKQFNCIKSSNGLSQTAIFEYINHSLTDSAVTSLSNIELFGRKLMVQKVPEQAAKLLLQPSANVPKIGTPPAMKISKIIRLSNMVSDEDLEDSEMYQDLLEEVTDECNKYGQVISINIPRNTSTDKDVNGVGYIFVEYSNENETEKAIKAIGGRKFSGKIVVAEYYSEDLYHKKVYNSASKD